MHWVLFIAVIAILMAIDLGVFQKKERDVTIKESLLWTVVWVSLALLFALWIYTSMGHEFAMQFLAGYLIEESLSVDNLFVFLLIFSYFKVSKQHQRRILVWGVVGAMIMRMAFILGGIALMHRFEWLIYFFGSILVFTGLKLAFEKEKKIDPEKSLVLRFIRKVIPVTEHNEGGKFFVRHKGKIHATPLFIVLMVIETSDVIFAVDSIPAIFAITLDPFIVFTSNVFAIMGLRSLFFALSGALDAFHYLNIGLSIILIFVGVKMLVAKFFHLPPVVSLSVIIVVLTCSVLASLAWPQKKTEH